MGLRPPRHRLSLPKLVVDILIDHRLDSDRYRSEGKTVQEEKGLIKESHRRKTVEKVEKYLREGKQETFEVEVEDELRTTDIAPPPMHEHQFPQVIELHDGIIRGMGRSSPLIP